MLRENYEYKSWREVPVAEFKARWPNFSPEEIACNGDGKVMLNFAALDALQKLRVKLGRPIILNSAYRSPAYNAKIGGAKASKHMEGIAFDCSMTNHNPEEFERAAVSLGFRGIGHYPGSNFMHIDTRKSSTVVRWVGTGKNARWFFTASSRPAPAPVPARALSGIAGQLVDSALGSSGAGRVTESVVETVGKLVDDGKLDKNDVVEVIGEVIEALPVNQDFNPPAVPGIIMVLKKFWPIITPAIIGPVTALTEAQAPTQWIVGGVTLAIAVVGSVYVYRDAHRGPEHENA
jgi:zinc D-Ala-D-Ala carboxypeptidase